MEYSEVAYGLLIEVQLLKELGLENKEVWEHLQGVMCTDKELDQLVALLEDRGLESLSEDISCDIHTPTLQGDIARSAKGQENDHCANADWQQPKTWRIDV